MRTLSTTGTAAPLTVETGLSDDQALAVLARCTSTFAADLLAQHNRHLYTPRGRTGSYVYSEPRPLSGNQMVWVHKLALERLAREGAPAGRALNPAGPDFSRVRALFDKAREAGRKFPKMRFAKDSLVIVLSLAGERSRTPGAVNITDERRYPDNTWYGRVNVDGTFTAGRDLTPPAREFLEALAADPERVAAEYGRETGNCCFCGKVLTVACTPWGPDCAKVWGLPYDSITARATRARRATQATRAERAVAAEAGAQGLAAVEMAARGDDGDGFPGNRVALGPSFPDHDLVH
jgi:hypothetical protein